MSTGNKPAAVLTRPAPAAGTIAPAYGDLWSDAGKGIATGWNAATNPDTYTDAADAAWDFTVDCTQDPKGCADKIAKFGAAVLQSVKEFGNNFLNMLKQDVLAAWKQIKNVMSMLLSVIGGAIENAILEAASTVIDLTLQPFMSGIKTDFYVRTPVTLAPEDSAT